MTRACDACEAARPLRDFDLGGGQLSTTCCACAHERLRTESSRARGDRFARVALLEQRRRELIAALVKIDAEIADLGPRPRSTPSRLVYVVENDDDSLDAPFDDVFGSDDRAADEVS